MTFYTQIITCTNSNFRIYSFNLERIVISKMIILKNKAHILPFRETDGNIRQLASTVEMLLWSHLCSWRSLGLHKNDHFMELMLRVSSCDTDQFSCWTLSSHLPVCGEQPQGGGPVLYFFSLWAIPYSFLTIFSLIRYMAHAQVGKSSLCSCTLCLFRTFIYDHLVKM